MVIVEINGKDLKVIFGKIVFVWFISFFGVVFIVNGIFFYLVFGLFLGVVVESFYEVGQIYNQEIVVVRV